MRYVSRTLGNELRKAAKHFPCVVVSGPRRAGKTYLLKKLFPKASYVLLEDPDVIARIQSDPRSFLDEIRLPVILDEIQNTPELFRYLRTRIDSSSSSGKWLVTGSQDFSLMKNVTESMAGRAAILQLLPFSYREIGKWNLLHGSFPEVVANPRARDLWFRSYIQTYLERDVRTMLAIRNLATFRRFLALLASRSGQILNRSDLAAPLGVSVPTINSWLSVLETTAQILLVPPYFENFGKRLVKSPKLYWMDSGLLCHLLGIETQGALERSTFAGSIFEGFVASEIIKNQVHQGRQREIYYFRDQQGLEIDFLVPFPEGRVMLLEVKWSKTPRPSDGAPLRKLMNSMRLSDVKSFVIYRSHATSDITSLAPKIKAIPLEKFLRLFPDLPWGKWV